MAYEIDCYEDALALISQTDIGSCPLLTNRVLAFFLEHETTLIKLMSLPNPYDRHKFHCGVNPNTQKQYLYSLTAFSETHKHEISFYNDCVYYGIHIFPKCGQNVLPLKRSRYGHLLRKVQGNISGYEVMDDISYFEYDFPPLNYHFPQTHLILDPISFGVK